MQFELFFPFIIVIALIIVFHIGNIKKNRALRSISSHFNGSVSRFSFFPVLKGEYHGLKFSITLTPASKSSPPQLKVSLRKGCTMKLSISRESFSTNLGKKIGLLREVNINDESFDKEFLILSNDYAKAASYLSNETIKNTIRKLFIDGFYYIGANGRVVTVRKQNYILGKDLNIAFVREVLQSLILFSKGL